MAAQEDHDLIDAEVRRRIHTQAFNPFQEKENCFYVALGRLSSLDSTTVAAWTGRDERETAGVGLDIKSQQRIVDRLNELTRGVDKLIFVDLALPCHSEDREQVGQGCLTMESLIGVVKRHGLTGRSFAISVSHPDADMSHYLTVQCTLPQQWNPETDSPEEGTDNLDAWKVEDFQFYHAHEDVHLNFLKGSVLQIIGKRAVKDTIYGSSKASIEQFFGKPPVERSERAKPANEFDEAVKKWKFRIYHHGHWGIGHCIQEDQTAACAPEWEFIDSTPESGRQWHAGEGWWVYRFGDLPWKRPVFTQCNTAIGGLEKTGWGTPCHQTSQFYT